MLKKAGEKPLHLGHLLVTREAAIDLRDIQGLGRPAEDEIDVYFGGSHFIKLRVPAAGNWHETIMSWWQGAKQIAAEIDSDTAMDPLLLLNQLRSLQRAQGGHVLEVCQVCGHDQMGIPCEHEEPAVETVETVGQVQILRTALLKAEASLSADEFATRRKNLEERLRFAGMREMADKVGEPGFLPEARPNPIGEVRHMPPQPQGVKGELDQSYSDSIQPGPQGVRMGVEMVRIASWSPA